MSFELNGITFAADGSISAGTRVEKGLIDQATTSVLAISKVASSEETVYHSESTLGMTALVNATVGFLAGDWFGNGRGREGKGALIRFGKV